MLPTISPRLSISMPNWWWVHGSSPLTGPTTTQPPTWGTGNWMTHRFSAEEASVGIVVGVSPHGSSSYQPLCRPVKFITELDASGIDDNHGTTLPPKLPTATLVVAVLAVAAANTDTGMMRRTRSTRSTRRPMRRRVSLVSVQMCSYYKSS